MFSEGARAHRLRPYQVEAVEAIRSRWTAGDRATLLVLATGLGKTTVFAEVAKQFAGQGKRSLVIAHRSELVTQATARIASLGLDVAVEQAGKRAGRSYSVVVGSVQTLQGRRLERWSPDHFGLVVVDEAHHTAAVTYRRILDHFASAKVLGVTATPDRGDKKALGALFQSTAYRLEIAEGIKQGYLSPIRAQRVVVDGLDLSAIRTTAGDLNQGDLDLAMRAPAAVHGVAEPIVKLSQGRPTLAFGVTVEHARALAAAVNEMEPGAADCLDGTSHDDVRAAVLRRFARGEVRILFNCALFTEGFDAPHTACIALARPTKSRALYAQMVGRGTRLADGKTDCLVLDFAGMAGRHKLIGPADVLAGEDLADDVRQELEEMLAGGDVDVMEAIADAQEAVAERKRPKPKPPAIKWSAMEVDLFGDLGAAVNPDWVGKPITDRQREILLERGVDIARLDRADASALIEAMRERWKEGLCTLKQARVLTRWGLPVERLPFAVARELLDRLAQMRWRPSSDWVEQARKYADEQIAKGAHP